MKTKFISLENSTTIKDCRFVQSTPTPIPGQREDLGENMS